MAFAMSAGIALEKVISDTKRDVLAMSERSSEIIGKIEKHRFIASNSPVIAGTRVPVKAIQSFSDAGILSSKFALNIHRLQKMTLKPKLYLDQKSRLRDKENHSTFVS